MREKEICAIFVMIWEFTRDSGALGLIRREIEGIRDICSRAKKANSLVL